MAGLFDWLNEGLGSGLGSSMPPLPQADNLPTRPMPPPQMTGTDAPNLADPLTNDIGAGMQGGGPPIPPYPPGGDPMTADRPQGPDPMTAGGGPNPSGLPPQLPPYPPGSDPMTAGGTPGNGPGLPPNMPVPMPRPRPAMSPPIPPNAAPTAGAGVPDAVRSYQGAGGTFAPPGGGEVPAQSFIGRALGLDRNKERGAFEGIAAGLTAAGNSSGKSKFQALTSGGGAALEGSNKADDKTTNEQDRFLGRQIAAKNAENTAATGATNRNLNVARTELALAQAKQAMTGGKESVVNSPEQLYLRAQSAAAQDGRLKALKTQADQAATAFGPDSPQAKAALKAHKDAYDATVEGHAKTLGLDPAKMAKIGKQPGMSADNPVSLKGMTQDKLNGLPVGAFIVGPDGKVLVKKPPAAATAGANPATPPQQMAPPVPPVPVTAPAGSRADTSDDED